MELTPIFIVFIVFGSIVAVIVGPSYLKSRERTEMQLTVRHAVDKGQTLPPELIDAMTKDVQKSLPSRTKDIRKGVLSLAAGAGLAATGLATIGGSERIATSKRWGCAATGAGAPPPGAGAGPGPGPPGTAGGRTPSPPRRQASWTS